MRAFVWAVAYAVSVAFFHVVVFGAVPATEIYFVAGVGYLFGATSHKGDT